MARIELKGVHRVSRRLANGAVREHHYAWRRGPKFWSSESGVRKYSAEYVRLFVDAERQFKEAFAKGQSGGRFESVAQSVEKFMASTDYRKNSVRTQADYSLWLHRIVEHFGEEPMEFFQYRESIEEIEDWLSPWTGSPRQFDYGRGVLLRFLNWAESRNKLKEHFCAKVSRLYNGERAGDRSETIWRPEEIALFRKEAPDWVWRILLLACETGLRPGDLVTLKMSMVGEDCIQLKTKKRGSLATIPLTRTLRGLLDGTPQGRDLVLVGGDGLALNAVSASRAVSRWRDRIAEKHGDKINKNLRLYDARGTAATRYVKAGLTLDIVAQLMGWKKRFAALMVEKYLAAGSLDVNRTLQILEG